MNTWLVLFCFLVLGSTHSFAVEVSISVTHVHDSAVSQTVLLLVSPDGQELSQTLESDGEVKFNVPGGNYALGVFYKGNIVVDEQIDISPKFPTYRQNLTLDG